MSALIVLMNGGRIEQMRTPVELYLRPAGLFSAQVVGNSYIFDAARGGQLVKLR